MGKSAKAVGGFGVSVRASLGQLVKGTLIVDATQAALEGLRQTVHLGIAEFADNAKVAAQTAAAIKSTGGIAGVSAKQVDALGLSLSNLSGVDDEVVRAGENVLLSFRNIRDQAGKGNDIFTRATKDAVDFAVRTGRDVPQAANLLGRALEDPARKAASLARAGIVLSASQLKLIKNLEASGHALEAQKILLAEVEKRFGGAAAAAGKTLPGQLNILRDRFKDLVGSGIGLVAPAAVKATTALTNIVKKLSEAQSVHAKLDVLFTGLKEVGKKAQSAISKAIAAVDWNKVWSSAKGLSDGLQKRLEAIDWGKVGTRIGNAFSDAVKFAIPATKELVNRIQAVIGAIDFVKLGKKLGPGLAAAVVTAFATLTDPTFWIHNWDLALAVGLTVFGGSVGRLAGKLAAPLARLGGDLVLKLLQPLDRFGPRVASVVLSGLLKLPAIVGRALSPLTGIVRRIFDRLGSITRFTVKVLGLQVVINALAGLVTRVAAIFGRIGAIIGGAFKNAFQAVEKRAIKTALGIIDPFTHIPGGVGKPFRELKDRLRASLDAMVSDTASARKHIQGSIDSLHGKTVTIKIVTSSDITQQILGPFNNFVANAKANLQSLLHVSTPSKPVNESLGLGDQAKLAAALAAARAKAARAAAAAARAAAAAEAKALQRLIDSLNLAVQKATLTKTLKDDLAANQALINALRTQIKLHKDDLSLQGDLVSAEQARKDLIQQQNDALVAARNAKQFKSLGLGPTGEQLVPLKAGLARELKQVTSQIQGTFLDTQKNRKLLAAIRKLVLSPFTTVSKEVRSTIKQMLDDLESQLKNSSGPLTKTTSLAGKIGQAFKGLGLTREQIKQLQGRFSGFNSAGVALAGAGGGTFGPSGVTTVVLHHETKLDGRVIERSTTKHQQRRHRQNPSSRRGRR